MLGDAIVDLEEKNAELTMIQKYQRVKNSKFYATDLDGKMAVRDVSKCQEAVLKRYAGLQAAMKLGQRSKKSKTGA